MKTTKLIQALAATALVLAITPAWAMEQDTGYPWYGDFPDKDRQTVSQPVNIFKLHPRTAGEDPGYPWHDVTKEEHSSMQPNTIIR